MISKPYAAHGYVIFIVTLNDGEEKEIIIKGDDGSYTGGYYYYVEGAAKYVVQDTGVELPTRTAGWLNLEHLDAKTDKPGIIMSTAQGKTSWVCVPHRNNPLGIPETLSCINAKKGETHDLKNGSNLFIAKGVIQVGENLFAGPSQLRVRNGDTSFLSKTDAYILVFP